MKKLIIVVGVVSMSLSSCMRNCYCSVDVYRRETDGSRGELRSSRPYSDNCSDDGLVLSPYEIVRCM